MVSGGGGVLLNTDTVTAAEVAALVEMSTARAVIECEPSATLVEFQSKLYGALESEPTTVPSTRKSTWSTPASSVAAALSLAVPLTVEPSLGEVTDTDGGAVSIWISCELTASALPAWSNARYLTVVVDVTGNGAL